jgi:beta-lactamase regulating signal transducer with metallopeptidase domain
MLQTIRNLTLEHLFFNIQPLLLGSCAKWCALFIFIFPLLAMYRRLSSDVRHIILLLLVYAVVLIPLANAVFPLEWLGNTTLARQGNEITETVNTALIPHYVHGKSVGVISAGSPNQLTTLPLAPVGVPWPLILFALWGAGVVATSFGPVIGRYRAGVLCRRDCTPPTGGVPRELESLVKKLGIRRSVGLVISPSCRVPFTFRLFNPLVVLPRTSDSWPLERVRTVLLHELFHIRRGDYLTKLLARMVCSLFWFLPFLWVAFSRLSLAQETACDLSVLRRGIRPTEYARHILEVASLSMKTLSVQGSFLAEGRKKTLERRIIHALQFDKGKIKEMGGSKMKTTKLMLVCTLIVAVIVIIGSCAASKKTTVESESIRSILTGTWINYEYDDMLDLPAKTILNSDGSFDFFEDVDDTRRSWWGQYTIIDSWMDSTGTYWYEAKIDNNWTESVVYYELGKIDSTKSVWEFIDYSVSFPDKWEPDNMRYLYRIYYRQ